MKTFYASVECAERGLDPFETNLVVADETRGKDALCLAITPKLKAQGIRNRCRMSEIPANIKYETALPRMQLYIDYAADIYSIYLDYFAPEDIYVYSIDESFIDATDYLSMYKTDGISLAKKMMVEIATRLHIPSTAGVGTNLYLAKIALDITAKHTKDHIGYLDEKRYRDTLWYHKPITDFWMVAGGTASRLARYGIFDMHGIATAPEELMYKTFGVNAELLIDHAWGRETCRMEDIRNYKTRSKSVSFSQILPKDYNFHDARTVLSEMVYNGALELARRKLVAGKISFFVGYTRSIIPETTGSVKLSHQTNLGSGFVTPVLEEYDKKTDRNVMIRRLGIAFENICSEESAQYDLFTDTEEEEKQKKLQHTVLGLKDRFGKNILLRGINYMPESTQRERNEMIGGHRAGFNDDSTRKS